MLYVRSIASLLDWFRSHATEQQGRGAWQAAPPLVINTHGWIKVGLWLLTSDRAFALQLSLWRTARDCCWRRSKKARLLHSFNAVCTRLWLKTRTGGNMPDAHCTASDNTRCALALTSCHFSGFPDHPCHPNLRQPDPAHNCRRAPAWIC